jgi:phosphoribosylaminoimidazolecarboxamide formyltransferase/IMP cyclohydrolase
MTGPLRLVVLVSGSGSNLQALIDAGAVADSAYRVVAVGADRDGTPGLERAVRATASRRSCAAFPTTRDARRLGRGAWRA